MSITIPAYRIERSFSRSACRYEEFSELQFSVGKELLKKIPKVKPHPLVLDIGVGTGRLTEELNRLFPGSRVIGMDLAPGMLEQARKKIPHSPLLQADAAALPFKPRSFDLMISNLAYQWVDDLASAFSLNYGALKRQGVFSLAVFGRQTLKELFDCLEKNFDGRGWRRLPSREDYLSALKAAGFRVESETRKIMVEHFSDFWDLIRWLKNIGANISGRNVFWGKKRFAAAAQYYQKHYSNGRGVYASFEALWIVARK